jgi:ABC-2 type transport system permease protein
MTSRRQANGLGAVALGVAWAVRMLADAQDGRDALRWLTPLGWVENLRPLTDPQPWWAFPIVLLTAACLVAGAVAAVRRDVGAGLRPARDARAPQLQLLESATGLGFRLERGVALGWVVSLALLGAVFGLVARAVSESGIDDELVGETVSRMGGAGAGAAAWIGYEFIYLAGILCFAAAGQISAMRNEETEGHLDHLLSRPVGRTAWLLGRLAVGVALVTAAGIAAGLGGWVGVAGSGSVMLGDMLRAGFNIVVPAVLVLGLGTLLLGLVPRLAVPLLYAFVLWSVLGSTFGTALVDSDWIIDTAVLTDLTPVPAAALDWTAIGVLSGLALLSAAVGAMAFRHRDLTSA